MLCMMTLNIERNGNTLADAEPAVTKLVWSQSLLPVLGDTGGLSRSEPSLFPCSCVSLRGSGWRGVRLEMALSLAILSTIWLLI